MLKNIFLKALVNNVEPQQIADAVVDMASEGTWLVWKNGEPDVSQAQNYTGPRLCVREGSCFEVTDISGDKRIYHAQRNICDPKGAGLDIHNTAELVWHNSAIVICPEGYPEVAIRLLDHGGRALLGGLLSMLASAEGLDDKSEC